MRKKLHKHTSHDTELIPQNIFPKQKNVYVGEDQDRNIAIVLIYGVIDEPDEYVDELLKLNCLSSKYDVVEVTLNSPGGSLNTTVDMLSTINKFEVVITIGKGEVASAAFMLWASGDIRVVTDYSMYMAHRESYGMYGKTSEHRDAAQTFGKVYEELFEECFGDLLNDKEKLIAERSETWLSYKDLLERDRVISYDKYVVPTNLYSVVELFVTDSGSIFMKDPDSDSFRSVTLQYGDEALENMTNYLYGIAPITKMPTEVPTTKPKANISSRLKNKNVKSTDDTTSTNKKPKNKTGENNE
jgi:ATP-dependent protease ClpP protease subunit